MPHPSDVLIGLHAGAAAMSALGFDAAGRQLGSGTAPHPHSADDRGRVEREPGATWHAALQALRRLADAVPDLARRTVGLAITGESDGTWLIDGDGDPVGPALHGRDVRAAAIAAAWRQGPEGAAVYRRTGAVLSAALQSSQLAWLLQQAPEALERATTACHCKDWLYFCSTGERVTDAADAVPSFGDVRRRAYAPEVPEQLGLGQLTRLLPEIVDPLEHRGEVSPAASAATGLREGTPVVLAPPEAVAAALAAGILEDRSGLACSILDETAVHLRVFRGERAIRLPEPPAGCVLPEPLQDVWLGAMPTVAATASVDWLVGLAEEVLGDAGLIGLPRGDLRAMLDRKAAAAERGAVLFHPYLSESGERSPFLDPLARGQLHGLSPRTGLGELMRGVYEGVGFAARDCYHALGFVPEEVRLAGSAARPIVRRILATILDAPVRPVRREVPAAAGAAMVAAVALERYGSLADASADWVAPHLGEPERPDGAFVPRYARLFDAYREARAQSEGLWRDLAAARTAGD